MLTAADIRPLIEGKPGNFIIPFYLEYSDVCNDQVFVRIESINVITPPHPLVPAGNAPGILMVVSLVSPEDAIEEEVDFSKTVPLKCPHCQADLTKPASIDVVLSLLDMTVEFPTYADANGSVTDTPSGDIANGHLSSMTCAKCNESLEDLEEEKEELKTFQFSLEGFDGGTDKQDYLVKWVNAPSRESLDKWLATQTFKIDGTGIDDIPLFTEEDGVDITLNRNGEIVSGEIGDIKPH